MLLWPEIGGLLLASSKVLGLGGERQQLQMTADRVSPTRARCWWTQMCRQEKDKQALDIVKHRAMEGTAPQRKHSKSRHRERRLLNQRQDVPDHFPGIQRRGLRELFVP
mmetsp:Transcript_63979/g.105620  ORF Transcript_63979/g.105620 Transcript_63979/m.105620 type:complete len:109 (+) Transcript_63979:291-617(+)